MVPIQTILEKEVAIHSSTIAWKIPWTEEPGRLQSMGSQRVGHDWATSLIQTTEGQSLLTLCSPNIYLSSPLKWGNKSRNESTHCCVYFLTWFATEDSENLSVATICPSPCWSCSSELRGQTKWILGLETHQSRPLLLLGWARILNFSV